jgi:hypothetical protein
MPTYRHEETSKRFLYVHIPRTAGRFLEENILNNGFKCEQANPWTSICGTEIAHFHEELYTKYLDCESIPHITVVRDPVDRFFSASIFLTRMYGDDIESLLEDESSFYSMIENFPLSEAVNWFRPQSDFIGGHTHIWWYENKLENDFSDWMSDILKVDFKIQNLEYSKLTTNETKKIKRTPKIIENVKKLYSKDYKTLYPK